MERILCMNICSSAPQWNPFLHIPVVSKSGAEVHPTKLQAFVFINCNVSNVCKIAFISSYFPPFPWGWNSVLCPYACAEHTCCVPIVGPILDSIF